MSTSAQAGQPARQVRDCFDWNDPNNYQWTIWLPNADTAELIGYLLAAAVIFPLMIYGFFYGIAYFSEESAYWICASVSALLFIGIVVSFVQVFRGEERERKQARSNSYFFAIMLLGCLLYLLSVPQSHLGTCFFCETAKADVKNVTTAAAGNTARDAADAKRPGFWQWMLFFADNTISVLLLDIPEIFEIRFSTIKHGQDWLSRSLTVLIRLLITLGLVELILEYYRTRFFKQHFYGTVQECYYHLSALPDPSQLQLKCEGRVTALSNACEFPVVQFVDAFKQPAEKPA